MWGLVQGVSHLAKSRHRGETLLIVGQWESEQPLGEFHSLVRVKPAVDPIGAYDPLLADNVPTTPEKLLGASELDHHVEAQNR
jgi:hypothetical protein